VVFKLHLYFFTIEKILPLCGKKKGGGIFAASPQGKKEKIKITNGRGRLGAGGG
jgi:hypothetical protein